MQKFLTDVHDVKTRSYNMSRIKAKDTKPEMLVRKFLFVNGYRYRLHCKDLPGKPDIVLPKYKTVIRVNGCFWHGHKDCKYYILPRTRRGWWKMKIEKTIEREKLNRRVLENKGWRVMDIFECELKKNKQTLTLRNLIENLICQGIK